TSSPAQNATSATISEAFSTPCPPRPAITMLVTLVLLLKAVLRYPLAGSGPFILLDSAGRQQAVAASHNHREISPDKARSYQLLEGSGINCRIGNMNAGIAK